MRPIRIPAWGYIGLHVVSVIVFAVYVGGNAVRERCYPTVRVLSVAVQTNRIGFYSIRTTSKGKNRIMEPVRVSSNAVIGYRTGDHDEAIGSLEIWNCTYEIDNGEMVFMTNAIQMSFANTIVTNVMPGSKVITE